MKDLGLFKSYLKDISSHRLLTRDEEVELSKQIQAGDKEALETMVSSNLKLVVKISLEFYKNSASIMDIIQNGNIGLIKAAEKFDHTKGVKFSTYAAFWIRQSILRGFIKPSHNVNISYRKDAINKKIRNYIQDYFEKDGKFPKVEEITEELHVSRRDAVDVLVYFKTIDCSLNDMIFEEGEELINSISDEKFNPERVVENELLEQEVYSAVESFDEREKDIIFHRFGFNDCQRETLQSLGSKYDITAEAARQIEKRVLVSMKSQFPALAYYFYT